VVGSLYATRCLRLILVNLPSSQRFQTFILLHSYGPRNLVLATGSKEVHHLKCSLCFFIVHPKPYNNTLGRLTWPLWKDSDPLVGPTEFECGSLAMKLLGFWEGGGRRGNARACAEFLQTKICDQWRFRRSHHIFHHRFRLGVTYSEECQDPCNTQRKISRPIQLDGAFSDRGSYPVWRQKGTPYLAYGHPK
jgi:hypothetical protein